MATNRFYSKTKLAARSQDRQTLKRSCYRLYSVAMGQTPRSTEHISSKIKKIRITKVIIFHKLAYSKLVSLWRLQSANYIPFFLLFPNSLYIFYYIFFRSSLRKK